MRIEIDLDEVQEMANDALVEVIIDTIPDMTTDELSQIEFAIGVELQERAAAASLFNAP